MRETWFGVIYTMLNGQKRLYFACNVQEMRPHC